MKIRRKVLLVVPHQDDELFVGGGLLKTFAQSKEYEVYVVFTTNGDFFPDEGEVRLRESLRVLTGLYHIEEKHIFFLGYGDGWKSDRHLYNQEDACVIESASGRRETYGISGHDDYRKNKSGRHSAYCRDNFKADLKELLADLLADIVIAVDYDKHPDHKAASLMTEECMGELLRERREYRPLVLKRYAYDGVWKGKADFFELPRRRTILSQPEHSPYAQEDRICVGMPPECSTPRLRHNFLYAAAKCYKTQEVWQKADEIINIDEVYWKRNTDNLLYEAELEASSGQAEYIRDFKLFDCGDVLQKELVLKECAWMPERADADRRIHIHFRTPQTISQINLFALGGRKQDELAGRFVFDDGNVLQTGKIRLDGKKNPLFFEALHDIQDMDFFVTKCVGSPVGITQMELLPKRDGDVPEELLGLAFQGDTLEETAYNRMTMAVEKRVLSLKRKISRWLPNVFFLRRHYPELSRKRTLLTIYRIKYILERIRNRKPNAL